MMFSRRCVNRAWSIPYFFEYSVRIFLRRQCLPSLEAGGEHSLSFPRIVDREYIVFPRSHASFSSIIKCQARHL